MTLYSLAKDYGQFHKLFERCAKRSYRTVFSHGDLAPRNILVKGTLWESLTGRQRGGTQNIGNMRSNLDAPEWEERLCKLILESAEDGLSSVFTRC